MLCQRTGRPLLSTVLAAPWRGGKRGTAPHSDLHMCSVALLHPLPTWPHFPPSPSARAADAAVVLRPLGYRLESERPVLCGCQGSWGRGQAPANMHTRRPCLHRSPHMCLQTGGEAAAPSYPLAACLSLVGPVGTGVDREAEEVTVAALPCL